MMPYVIGTFPMIYVMSCKENNKMKKSTNTDEIQKGDEGMTGKKYRYEKTQKQEAINDVMLHDSREYFYEANGGYQPIDKNSPLNTLFRAFRKVELTPEEVEAEAVEELVKAFHFISKSGYGSIELTSQDLAINRSKAEYAIKALRTKQ